MFRPSETANDLFRRLHPVEKFDLKLDHGITEKISFGEAVELQNTDGNAVELVLRAALQFAEQFTDGMIIHVSTTNSLYNSLLYSRFDVSTTSLAAFHTESRLKSVVISNTLQLTAVFEMLKIRRLSVPTLVLLEHMTPVLLASKPVCGGSHSSQLSAVFTGMHSLLQAEQLISLWVTETATPKACLRDGNPKDSLSTAWKRNVPRFIHSG